jgi:hypothetical protein
MNSKRKVLIYLAYTALALVVAKRRKETDPKYDNFGFVDITINPPFATFDADNKISDQLVFLYVFDSKQERSG